MGVVVEFNPDLALRVFGTPGRLPDECFPETLEVGGIYAFLKEGQRNYWLQGAIPLMTTTGKGNLSRPVAAISILSVEHICDENNLLWTSGFYGVHALFNSLDTTTHFEGMDWKGTGNLLPPVRKEGNKSLLHKGSAYTARIGGSS